MMMRSTLALVLALALALASTGCGQPASPPFTTPVPTASATSPLYVPARPADLDVALAHDAGPDAALDGGPDAFAKDVDAGRVD